MTSNPLHLPQRAEAFRRVVERLDPETLTYFDCHLHSILRNMERGRIDLVKADIDELRALIRDHEAAWRG